MLSDKAFNKGLITIRAVFKFDPDEETARVWRLYLNELDDESFLKGVFLLGHPKEGLRDVYPHTNIPACIFEYVEKARSIEKARQPKIKEDWEIEREKLLLAEHKKIEEERRRAYSQLPDSRHVKNVKCLFLEDKR